MTRRQPLIHSMWWITGHHHPETHHERVQPLGDGRAVYRAVYGST